MLIEVSQTMNSRKSKKLSDQYCNANQRAENDQGQEEEPHSKLSAAGIRKKVECIAMNHSERLLSVMINISPMSSTYPAPFIFALGTCHMLTTLIFLDRNITLRTLLGFNCNCPFFKLFILVLLARQILMPRNDTVKAEHLFAVVASNLNRWFVWGFHHNILAFGIRTELFQVARHHLLVCFELSKLFVSGLVTDFFDKIVRHRLFATSLRAFDEKSLAPRLSDLISEEVSVTIFAEGVPTTSICYKVTFIMLFIANLAKFRVYHLLRLNN